MGIKRVRDGPGEPDWIDHIQGLDVREGHVIWDISVPPEDEAYIVAQNTVSLQDYE